LSAPKGGIFYFPTFGNNIFANRLNGRFVSYTSTAHRPKIRRRVIPHIRHLGTPEGAATGDQVNPLVAHNIILSRLPPRTAATAPGRFLAPAAAGLSLQLPKKARDTPIDITMKQLSPVQQWVS
jgi:hypothetical protein